MNLNKVRNPQKYVSGNLISRRDRSVLAEQYIILRVENQAHS